jgi:outer membrane protein W
MGHNTIGTNQTIRNNTRTNSTVSQNVVGAYGAGVTKTISLGSMLTKNIGLDVGMLHLAGNKYNAFYDHNDNSRTFRQDLQTYARMSAFTAGMVFTADGSGFQPYAKAGLTAGKPKIFNEIKLTEDGRNYEMAYEASGKVSLGFQGSIGITYPVAPKWMLFTEGNFTAFSFSPEKSILTKYTENGVDYLERIPVYHKETIYKNSVEVTNESVSGPLNNPREQLGYSSSFNSLGVQLGIKFNLR